MKTLAAAVSAFAVVNLVALLVAGGWLWQSDRLSRERVQAVREIFALTNAEQTAQEEAEAAEASRQARLIEAEREAERPPRTADEELADLRYSNEQAEIALARMRQEVAVLQQALRNEKHALAQERSRFEAEKRAFEQFQERLREARESEQFERTMAIYQGLDADAVKDIWMALIQRGQMEQVVVFLGELPPRKATEVVAEFEREDPTLAADLLERLRTHGLARGID